MKTLATSLALAAAATLVVGCGAAPTDESTTSASAEVQSCATGPTVEGIDVSIYEGTVDWDAVKRSGRAFAFARVSDGVTHVDSTFDANWAAIRAHGLVRGVYQFFRVGEDPIAQADLLIEKIGALGPGDLPPVLDLETGDGYPSATIVEHAQRWLDRVQQATGRAPIVYTAMGFWNDLSGTSSFGKYPLWVANYGVRCPSMPDSWGAWRFWQYSESGSVPGISGNVDLSVWNGTLAELEAFAGGAGGAPAEAIEVYWARDASGRYDLRALAPADVARVEYVVDGYTIGAASRSAGANFPAEYTFYEEGTNRRFEAKGYDAKDRLVAHGVGAIDVTAGVAAYVKEMGAGLYEIGLERPPSEVAAIEVRADGTQLTDAVSNATRSTRDAVRARLTTLGPRTFVITTFGADGAPRGTLTRTLTVE